MLIDRFEIRGAEVLTKTKSFRPILVPELVISDKRKGPCQLRYSSDDAEYTTVLTGTTDYSFFCLQEAGREAITKKKGRFGESKIS